MHEAPRHMAAAPRAAWVAPSAQPPKPNPLGKARCVCPKQGAELSWGASMQMVQARSRVSLGVRPGNQASPTKGMCPTLPPSCLVQSLLLLIFFLPPSPAFPSVDPDLSLLAWMTPTETTHPKCCWDTGTAQGAVAPEEEEEEEAMLSTYSFGQEKVRGSRGWLCTITSSKI